MGVQGNGIPDDSILAKHYGSLFTLQDWENTSHFAFVSASFVPTNKLTLFGTFSYNKATGELEQVIMPDVSAEVAAALSHQDFTFDDMHTYSDLDYQILRFQIGGAYQIAPDWTWTADFEYADLTDDAPWVFGDESGSLFIVRSGVQFDF